MVTMLIYILGFDSACKASNRKWFEGSGFDCVAVSLQDSISSCADWI